MSLKAIYVCSMVLFFIALPAFAQDQPPSEEHQPPSAGDIVSKMQSKLNLTQDQVTAVSPIIEKYSSKRQELRQGIEDGTTEEDSIRSQMKQLIADEHQELSQFLSSEQMGQWEQMQRQDGHKHSSDAEVKENNGSSGE